MSYVKKLIAAMAVVITTMITTVGVASAWQTEQWASARCPGGSVSISGTFTNTEPKGSDLGMAVTMVTPYGSDGPKTVFPGNSEKFTVNTNLTSIPAGKVTFDLVWSNGSDGTDVLDASYDAAKCVAPKPAPKPAPPAPKPVPAPEVKPAPAAPKPTVLEPAPKPLPTPEVKPATVPEAPQPTVPEVKLEQPTPEVLLVPPAVVVAVPQQLPPAGGVAQTN